MKATLWLSSVTPLPFPPTGTERGPRETGETGRSRAAWTAWSGCECARSSPPFRLPSSPLVSPNPLPPGGAPSQHPGVRFNCCSPAGPAQTGEPGPRGSPEVPQQGPLASVPDPSVSGPVRQTTAPAHRRGESPASSCFSGNKGPLSRPLRAPGGCIRGPQELKAGPQDGGFVSTAGGPSGELFCSLGLSTPAGAPATGFPPAAPTPQHSTPGGWWVGPMGGGTSPVFVTSLDWL